MKLNVYNKLMIGFGIVLLLKFVMMGMDYMFMARTMAEAKDLQTDSVPTTKAYQHLMASLVTMEAGVRDYLLSGQEAYLEAYREGRQGAEADLTLLNEQAVRHPALKASVDQESSRVRDFTALMEGVVSQAKRGQLQAARGEFGRGQASMEACRQGFTALEQAVDKVVAETWGHVEHTEHQAQLAMWILGFLAVVVNQGIAFYLGRQFARNLKRVTQAAEGIARGDLNQEVAISTRDEFGDLAKTFGAMTAYLKEVAGVARAMSQGDLSRDIAPKGADDQFGVAIAQMIASLREVVSRVRSSADAVGTGAEQITHACSGLSKSSQVQAATTERTSTAIEAMAANIQSVDTSVQTLGGKVTMLSGESDELQAAVSETSRSISELVASVQQVTGNVGHANEASEAAAAAAGAGEEAVAKTIAGMQAIAETMGGIRETIQLLDRRSGEIGAIIEVIDDIAEQTNLLALNAAIEAARAGDAGRGFAVVADEVRKLAERSAKATGEIGGLIKGIQQETAQAVGATQVGAAKVQEGTQLASHTGQALQKIKDASTRVRVLLSEVTEATGAQSRASQKIETAADQMARINQQLIGAVHEMEDVTRTVAHATSEQRQGADQVVLAVENLNHASHESASETARVSDAANSLNAQAHNLQEAVEFFRLGDQGAIVELRVVKPLALPIRG